MLRHPFGWICHLSGWKRFIEESFPRIRGTYFILVNNSQEDIEAALPVFVENKLLSSRRFVSIPYATLCDPLVSSGADMKSLLEAASNYFSGMKYSHMEFRTFLSDSMMGNLGLRRCCNYIHHYLPLCPDPQELKKTFQKKMRQQLANIEQLGLKSRLAADCSDLDAFYHLYLKTRKRLGLPPQPYFFFRNLWDEFIPANRMEILLVSMNEKTIGGLLFLKFKKRMSADYLGIDDEYRDAGPERFLFWEAIKRACQEGYGVFDFGRAYLSNKSLIRFKGHWGTKTMELPQYYYPEATTIRPREESESYRIVRSICRKMPEPILRATGSLLYRFWI